MKQFLQKTLGLRAWMMVAMMVAAVTGAWADEPYYTLDATLSSNQTSNNAYASSGTVTVGDIEWVFVGNGTMNPWRLGGKSLSGIDRSIYTKTAMDAAISKVDLTVGAANNITVNSLKLIVASDANFNTKIEEVRATFNANSTISFMPTGGSWAKDAYFKFVFNVSVSVSSNKFVEISKVEFYQAEESNPEKTTPELSFNTTSYEATLGQTFTTPTLTNESEVTVSYRSSEPSVAEVNPETGDVTLVGEGTTVITASFPGNDTYNSASASYTLNVTDPSATTSVSIDGTGITNKNIYNGTAAGSLVAYVIANEEAIDGANVTWESSDNSVATIDDNGVVTLVGVGTTTITATYAGIVGQYKASSETFTFTVTNDDPTIVTLWSEDFLTSYNNNSEKYAYTIDKDSYVTTLNSDNYADGEIPELFLKKNVGSFMATIPLTRIQGDLTLSFKTNAKPITISTSTSGINIYGTASFNTKDTHTVTFKGVTTNTPSITIIFTAGNDNVRLDDIVLKGSQLPEGAVASPVIDVLETFIGSTTAEITCTTAGATIYYSYDNENWSVYSEPITITATTTIYAKAVKDEEESAVVSKTTTKTLPTPTVTINAEGITNTNVYAGTDAGTLIASVTYNDAALEEATVTWSGNNNGVATIDAQTGALTLVAAGSVTFTATYAGNDDYSEATATYQLTVTNNDPNAPGSENNPYSVAQAIDFIGTLGSETSSEQVYVSGIISQVDSYNSKYGSITYWISDNGTTTSQMEVYSGKGINDANFNSKDDLQVGDIVTIKGYVKMYNSTTPEFTQNNQLVSFERPENTDPAITVSPARISTTAVGTEGALELTYANLEISDATDFGVQFYDGEGEEASEPDWIEVVVTEDYAVSYTIESNDGEARTAYFKVYVMNDDELIYSNLATIIQEAPVVETVAELPFEYDGGRNDIADADGLTQEGLGSDYSSSPKLKFDSTDDYLILAFNERPGTLTFDIKGNSFSGGTFNVQTSEDGVTYTDLETYTELGNTQNEEFNNLGENVRYIKWIYTEKVSGNVALGNIALAKYVEPQPAQEYELSWSVGENVNEIFVFDNSETEALEGSSALVLEGNTVYVSVGFNDGYELEQLTVSAGETPVDITEIKSGYYSFVMPAAATTITVSAKAETAAVAGSWIKTELADLTSEDVFVIVGNNDDNYAMSNDKGTGSAPAAVGVTIANDMITSEVGDTIKWNISGNATDGYTFYPNGETESWLYCTNTNNGVRVGTNENNVFTFDGDYLFNNATERYVGIYNSQDWRCYTSNSGTSNIANQTFSFYKQVDYARSIANVGNYGTICLPYNATISGAQLYSIAGKKLNEIGQPESIVIQEEPELEAGKPYIFQATKSMIVCKYTSEVPVTTAESVNGLVGSLTGTTVDENMYLVSKNQIILCGTGCTIGANRAYIDMSHVDEYTGSEAGVKMLTIGDTAVGIAGIGAESKNGSAIYNVAGQRVQKAVRGLYIVDGKKVLVK